MLAGFIFLGGLIIGSFLNVCIFRLPNSRSLILPGSSCPHCNQPIKFYDNIPILSYLWLCGKCRFCGHRISARYPLVELLSGILALALFVRYGITWPALILYVFAASLLIITFVDIDHKIIPDSITIPGIPIGFLASFFLPYVTWIDSLIGIVSGGGSLLVVAIIYEFIAKKEGMGGGDIKLLAMIGGFLGWQGVLFTIFSGSVLGTVVGIFVALKTKQGRQVAIPFGPFLSIGALLHIFQGHEIIRWYFELLR
ncbi:MAG: prepilin peptidase [Deltaproteobacteria bacterium]|nr:prepilin peptidase [Deltaproteobacteria bacterium]